MWPFGAKGTIPYSSLHLTIRSKRTGHHPIPCRYWLGVSLKSSQSTLQGRKCHSVHVVHVLSVLTLCVSPAKHLLGIQAILLKAIWRSTSKRRATKSLLRRYALAHLSRTLLCPNRCSFENHVFSPQDNADLNVNHPSSSKVKKLTEDDSEQSKKKDDGIGDGKGKAREEDQARATDTPGPMDWQESVV